jgi:uncharacterized protein YbjQ (UPF0145 family)
MESRYKSTSALLMHKASSVQISLRIFFAGLRDVFGGRSKTYEKVLEQAKEDALRELSQKAQEMGANGILGVDLDFETIGSGGSMLMVIATGTAVRL